MSLFDELRDLFDTTLRIRSKQTFLVSWPVTIASSNIFVSWITQQLACYKLRKARWGLIY